MSGGNRSGGFVEKAMRDTVVSAQRFMAQGKKSGKRIADKLADRRVTIGMTAQSGAGKTTATTSMINQLLNFDHKNARLAQFSPFNDDRIIEAKLHTLEDSDVTPFPYEAAYAALSGDPPRWPAPTQEASGCLVELCLKRPGARVLGRRHYSLFVEIRDYPGEWLVDLQLLDKDFIQWCNLCKGLYTVEPRKGLLGPLFDDLLSLDPFAPCVPETLNHLTRQFIDFLNRCKGEKQLSSVQPGRFTLAGPGLPLDPADVTLDLTRYGFIPLLAIPLQGLDAKALRRAPPNSYYQVCRAQYRHYLRDLVQPFYKNYFSKIDRQIVLVDIVSALEGGAEYISDLQFMLKEILQNFHYGKQNRLMSLIAPKIDTICFAATKMDQIVAQEHENVKQLLGRLIRNVSREISVSGIKSTCEVISAVNASHNKLHQNKPSVWGCNLAGEYVGYTHPQIPAGLPTAAQWQDFEISLPRFRPPVGISASNSDVLPHIRMDSILDLMIGRK